METEGLGSMTLEQLLAQYREKTKVTKIRSLNKDLGYLKARKVAEPYGGLPRNVTHKRTLVDSDDWTGLRSYYPAWAREILVYPESNGTFKKDEDIVDSYKDKEGREWVFPAYCVPDEAVDKKNVALFVTPFAIAEDASSVTVIAGSRKVVVLSNFPQRSHWGTVDEKTGIPLSAKNVDIWSNTSGYLCRLDTAGVRPLLRYYDRYFVDGSRAVVADYEHDLGFGVGVESLEEAPQNLESLTLGQLLSAVKKKKTISVDDGI